MEKRHKDLLISKTVFLVENLDMPLLYPHMTQTRLLSEEEVQILEVNCFLKIFTVFTLF